MQQWYTWLHGKKKRDEREKERGGASEAGQPDDFQCQGRSMFLAQNHDTNSLKGKFAGAGRIGGRCEAHEVMRGEEERVGEALAV